MKKILIIDDEQDLLEMLKFCLESAHFKVVTATDGVEGLVKAGDEKPDLIILDVMMRNLDGCAVMEELKKQNDLKHVPVIMLTGLKHLKTRMKNAGAADFFEKPFHTFDVVNRVKELVSV